MRRAHDFHRRGGPAVTRTATPSCSEDHLKSCAGGRVDDHILTFPSTGLQGLKPSVARFPSVEAIVRGQRQANGGIWITEQETLI